uniref:Receptor ligand binding region domain-containing protein n=1 Tax=Magallana gigas TaxID=29159 RepID=A0A8W8MGZ9_MAGGI
MTGSKKEQAMSSSKTNTLEPSLDRPYTTKTKFIQVGEVNNTQFTSIGSWILYDKENRRLRSTAVSWNKAFHYKCRSHVAFEQLTSPFISDIQIVGNLPLHYSSYTPEGCGEIRNNYVLFSEAIVFAVDSVNNLTDILPSVKLGYDIIDTCSVPSRFHQMDVLYSLGLRDASVKRKNYIGLDFHLVQELKV